MSDTATASVPATAPSSAPVSSLCVTIRNPYFPSDSSELYQFSLEIPTSSTISSLKSLIQTSYSLHPTPDSQRILVCGRLCADSEKISSLATADSTEKSISLTLVIKSLNNGATNPLPAISLFPSPILTFPPASSAARAHSSDFLFSQFSNPQLLALINEAIKNSPNRQAESSTPSASPAAAAANPTQAAAPLAAAAVPAPRLALTRLRVFLDLRVFIRLFVIYFLFYQGDSLRQILFFSAICFAYLFQVWNEGNRPEEILRRQNNGANAGEADNDEEALRRQMENDNPGGAEFQREREELEYFQQMNRLNRIRIADENGERIRMGTAEANAPPPGFIASTRRFLHGFFASLVPSYRPVIPDIIEENTAERANGAEPAIVENNEANNHNHREGSGVEHHANANANAAQPIAA